MSLKGSSVKCNAVHPGCMNTEITRNLGPVMQFIAAIVSPLLLLLGKTPSEGSYTSASVATSSQIEGVGAKYFYHCEAIRCGECGERDVDAEKLWKLSEKLTCLITEKQD